MRKKYFVAQEDVNVYNTFSVCDFDAEGYLWGHSGEDGYNMDDYKEQIVYETDSFEDAEKWVDKKLGYTN